MQYLLKFPKYYWFFENKHFMKMCKIVYHFIFLFQSIYILPKWRIRLYCTNPANKLWYHTISLVIHNIWDSKKWLNLKNETTMASKQIEWIENDHICPCIPPCSCTSLFSSTARLIPTKKDRSFYVLGLNCRPFACWYN